MRIAMISTYPPIECGIATYTENLCRALSREKNEIFIVSQHGAYGRNVYPVYNAADDNIAGEIYNLLAKLTPDVVHIQHEFGLYGVQHGIQLNELILRLKMAALPVAVTLHTVRNPMPRDDEIILENIVRDSQMIIVHEQQQKDVLAAAFGSSDHIRVIPHGIRNVEPVPRARELLEVVGKKTALLVGYVRPSKRFERIIELRPEVAEAVPDAVLILAGKMRGIEHSDYYKMMIRMAEKSPAADQILVLRGQFPQHTFDTIISGADCMLLPYEAGAQSGILANAAAFHVPVVTSDLESFVHWNQQSGGGLSATTDEEYVKQIIRLLCDDELRGRLKKNISTHIQPMLWEAAGRLHQSVYEEINRNLFGAPRHFYVPE